MRKLGSTTVLFLVLIGHGLVLASGPASAAVPSVQVKAVTISLTNQAGSRENAVASCPAGSVLVGGGAHRSRPLEASRATDLW